MVTDNADFEALFAESTSEVEAGGGVDVTSKSQNARVHKGDGEVIDPQDFSDDAEDLFAEDENDTDDVDDDGAEEVSEETDSPTETTFDWSEHKDELVTIKVNGEDITVPLGEALAGSMRQADYTRKTQEIAQLKDEAEWGREMKQALLADPKNVISQMAEAFGIKFGSAPEADEFEDVDDDLKPFASKLSAAEKRIADMQARMDAQAEAHAQELTMAEVKAELASVQAKYPDFDPNIILPLAIQYGLNMEDAYDLYLGKQAKEGKLPKAESKPSKKDVEDRKRKLNERVSAGQSHVATKPAVKEQAFDNFADMFLADLENSR